MGKKVFKIRTTAGVRYGIGVFSGGEMLRSTSSKMFKTRKGAERALKKMLR